MQSLIFKNTIRFNLARPAAVQLVQAPYAQFAATSTKNNEKALGDEKNFINKEEEKLLKELIKKVQKVAAPEEKKAELYAKEVKSLCTKFNIKVTDKLVADLVDWKLH